jgi:hypothetical protein
MIHSIAGEDRVDSEDATQKSPYVSVITEESSDVPCGDGESKAIDHLNALEEILDIENQVSGKCP